MQRLAIFVVIVAAIGLHDDELRQWLASLATNGWCGLDEGQQLGDVVAVGAREDQRERDALRFGQEVVLEPGRARSAGLGPVFDPIRLHEWRTNR